MTNVPKHVFMMANDDQCCSGSSIENIIVKTDNNWIITQLSVADSLRPPDVTQ